MHYVVFKDLSCIQSAHRRVEETMTGNRGVPSQHYFLFSNPDVDVLSEIMAQDSSRWHMTTDNLSRIQKTSLLQFTDFEGSTSIKRQC